MFQNYNRSLGTIAEDASVLLYFAHMHFFTKPINVILHEILDKMCYKMCGSRFELAIVFDMDFLMFSRISENILF